jgi:hypothetical protein
VAITAAAKMIAEQVTGERDAQLVEQATRDLRRHLN